MPIPWLAVAIGASTAVSFMGSLNTMKNMKAGAAWDKYHSTIRENYNITQANNRASELLSEKRAVIGARGVIHDTGSTLMEKNAVLANLEDTVFWINKGAKMSLKDIDLKLAGLLQKEAWEAGSSLLEGIGQSYTAYKRA